ncbi:MAG: hypothetical protein ACFE9N_03820 [Promethearchaeota archaeon]
MAKIEIHCPVCTHWKIIEISDDVTKNVSKGLLAINIATGMICEHSFIAYVDKNLIVRDCLVADFKIEISTSDTTEETKEKISPETDTIKFDLIKLNIPDMLMTFVFRTIFNGKKAVILSDQEFLFNHLLNFFKYVMENSFNFDINILPDIEYKKNKNKYKNYLVFKKREIIRDDEKLINPKSLEIEKSIVDKFFSEYDLMAGLIILKNEVNKAYKFAKTIADFIEDQKGKLITSKLIIENISEKHDEKIQMPYLKFLVEIVGNYFKVEVPKINGVTSLLGFL